MPYLTRQSVREEAGFQDTETEPLVGVVNGVNKVFATNRSPIVDRTFDDVVDATDVIVRYDGIPSTVSSLVPSTGIINVGTAPANNVEATIEYASSALSDAYVTELITEAEAIVNGALEKYITVPVSVELTQIYPRAKRIALFYASGFALVRDYGKNTDTEKSGNDGYAKLDQADKWLKQLITDVMGTSTDYGAGGAAQAVSEGHIFGHHSPDIRSHEYFMRKR